MNNELPTTTLVIFGITGDLASRYILPALAKLDELGQLPENFRLLGLSRRQISSEDVLKGETSRLKKYLETTQMDMADPADYQKLKEKLPAQGQKIFYLSIPPAAVMPILRRLSAAGLNHGNTKLLLEKPFGYDLESARELISEIEECFKEDQVYRIDHYMAKEMAQNISVFLGSNALFRKIWNNQFIDSIDIIAAEKIGIEGRADFYEQTGALRDIVQNHLMNLAALTLMRPCGSLFEFEDMPERRLEALKSLKAADPNGAVRAQYDGYQDEVSNERSLVETFAAVTLESSDPRWHGVPIKLVTGKNLDTKVTEIRVRFKQTDESQANELCLRIQPKEGVEIDLWAKQPGFSHDLRHLPLSFDYAQGAERLPNAYEQVLVDAMRSRTSLFAGAGEVLETWRVLQPILEHWQMNSNINTYKPGVAVEQVLEADV
ncbi:MAG TPA: glucose-6-phosphate dehydrogenase [Candidatus Saccharimonadales bacterium]|nr:glucose-6-phosphate dehydrogenase [Candidatus Saccharimonadales bacterium]